MEQIISFGDWVQRRRKILGLTQADLAENASCSLSMLRKIEGDERRPSDQLAEILAEQLEIDDSQLDLFLQMARGNYMTVLDEPISPVVTPPIPTFQTKEISEEQLPFVAREQELQQLHDHLENAVQGRGRLVFVAGEAGRGKTSLITQFARQALDARPNLIVAGGSSDVYTGLSNPLLPFRDILRMLAADIENPGMSGILTREATRRMERAFPLMVELLSTHGPDLIDTFVPRIALEGRLAQGLPEGQKNAAQLMWLRENRSKWGSAPVEMQQGQLFEEVSTTLTTLARSYPLLLMLDDLHWIDASSAGLLGHLIVRIKDSPILIVGSLRPEELDHVRPSETTSHQPFGNPIKEVINESQRLFGHNMIDLDRPDPDGVLDFINALVDQEPNRLSKEFREHLASITEGNPLFATELLRDLEERGDITQDDDGRWTETGPLSWEHFPARVEGIIEKRFGRLSEELRDLLTVGSVQGQSFFAEVVAWVKGMDARSLTRRLSAELDRQHRLIRELGVKRIGGQRISQYQFRHQLFQRYLYGRLAESERMYLHEDVGLALEAIYKDQLEDSDLPSAQLARHFQEARIAEKASHYLLHAGQDAARLLAFKDAVADFKQGLLLLENVGKSTDIRQLACELTLALGQAYWHEGSVGDSLPAIEQAIEIARGLEDPEYLAKAALAYEERRWRLSKDQRRSHQYLREALEKLGDMESPMRVRLLVVLSRVLLIAGEQQELQKTMEQTLKLARESNDPVALCDALLVSVEVDRRPERTIERMAVTEELIALAEEINELERLADSLDLYIYDQLEIGNIEMVDETIERQKKVAAEIKQPFQKHIGVVFQTMRAMMKGEFELAEQLALRASNISQELGISEMDGIYGMHMFTIRWQQGRLNEIAPIIKLMIQGDPTSGSWLPGLALIYAQLDLEDECRSVFESLVSSGLTFTPQDSMRAATLAYLTEVCAYLGDVKRAEMLYRLMLPFDGRSIVVGGATACYGAAARYLGKLATVLEDWQAAEGHFNGALALDSKMEAWPWLAHSKYEYAAMLLARGKTADLPSAKELLDEAETAANRMGMANLLEKVTILKAHHSFVTDPT